MHMDIESTITEQSVPAVLQMMGGAGCTGIVRIEGNVGKAEIGIRDGHVVYAKSDRAPGLGDSLVSQGLIHPQVVEDVLRVQRRKKIRQPLGTVLAELGLVSREEIEAGVVNYVKGILVDVMSWGDAGLNFEPCELEGDSPVLPGGLRIDRLLLGIALHLVSDKREKQVG